MRRANPQLQSDRQAEILDAAERCFARSGFHLASMQDICAEAGMSPGNLYRYFASKEALIAGISERNRAQAAAMLGEVGKAPDFFQALAEHARHHLVDRSAEEVGLCAEIMSESRRNPEVARLYEQIERDIKNHLAAMLRSAIERGEVRADLDVENAALALMVLADGMSWRRAVDRGFDADRLLPMILQMVHSLLAPSGGTKKSSEDVR